MHICTQQRYRPRPCNLRTSTLYVHRSAPAEHMQATLYACVCVPLTRHTRACAPHMCPPVTSVPLLPKLDRELAEHLQLNNLLLHLGLLRDYKVDRCAKHLPRRQARGMSRNSRKRPARGVRAKPHTHTHEECCCVGSSARVVCCVCSDGAQAPLVAAQ